MRQPLATPADASAPPKKRRSRKKRYIILGVVGLLVLWIITSVIMGKREKPIPVVTEKATKRTIVQTVSATGKVQPEVEVKISPEVAGEITELPVTDGMAVKKGDLLLKIRPDSYKALLDAQQAAISAAQATNLQMKAAAAKAEADLKRSQDLYTKKMISESEFVAAQTAYEVAKSTFDSSLYEIERAEAGSSQARDQLSKTTIYSPIDGTVTVLNSKQGERVVATNQFAGTEVMRVADLGQMEAHVDVNENDVVTVKKGDKAIVTIDAYGDRRFNGTVVLIANSGKTTGTGTQEEVTNFEVKIRLDNTDVQLAAGLELHRRHPDEHGDRCRCGADAERDDSHRRQQHEPGRNREEKEKQTARDKGDNAAELTNERLEKAQEREERENLMKVVFLKRGNKAVRVQVTTGIADDTYMEIKSGILPGDEVISGSYSAISRKLKDGAKVEIEKEEKKK